MAYSGCHVLLMVDYLHTSLCLQPSLTLACPTEQDGTLTRVTCNIGNPLEDENTVKVTTTIVPMDSLVGNEDPVTVNFSLTSVNRENSGTLGNNNASLRFMVNAIADITLDSPG